MQRLGPALLAAALILTPLGAIAADLVVWWEKGYYAQENEAVAEIIAAFEQKTGQQVELVFVGQDELPVRIEAALEAGRPPDFAFGLELGLYVRHGLSTIVSWTSRTPSAPSRTSSIRMRSIGTWPDAETGQKALYGLPIGRSSHHLHVWRNLLERAGFTLADIPREWEAFWSFWCDQVQPAVRKALGRDDIWGIGAPMAVEAYDTWMNLREFMLVYGAD